ACRAGPRSGTMAAVARSEAPNPRRAIPSVERLLRAPAGAALAVRWRRAHVVETTRAVLEEVRRAAGDGTPVPPEEEVLRRVAARLGAASAPRLVRVVNASGVVLHTNLGRAPLAEEAIAALVGAARHASNLELDLATGRRGDRDALLEEDLRALTGAEAALVAIGRQAGVPVMEDLGSGALLDLAAFGLPREPVVRERVAAGADLVTFSGDKLLGGPQAGIVVGRRDLVARLAANPLRRALRPGKLTLAALGATLRLYRETPDLPAALPVLRWLTRPLAELEAVGCAAAPALARRLGEGYRVTLVPSECEVGSGAVPAIPLASRAPA